MSDDFENHSEDEQKPDSNAEGDKVGRGRPPLHTRWRKGQSGNPEGGRKRKREPSAEIF
jgi:hypothetical protein